MSGFVVSTAARQERRDIQTYIAADNVETARKVIRRLRSSFRQLSQNPGLGHTRLDLTSQPVRFWPVYSFLIVYRTNERVLEIWQAIFNITVFALTPDRRRRATKTAFASRDRRRGRP
jgi:antitoxin ParD1/3/4/toxin ParE1/3/4